jgi:hypothetical protein
LLIGEYVQVSIIGRRLEQVYLVPRLALRDNDQIWLIGEGDKLVARTIEPLWRDDRVVVLKDSFEPGTQLVVSDVPGAVAGMTVKPVALGAEAQAAPAAPDVNPDRKAP